MSEQPAEWLSVAEFCELLRLPRSSVYEAISGGKLAHRRVGRSIRIHRDAGLVQASPTTRPAQRRRALVIVRRTSKKKPA